jgi:hypothetical protein
MVVTLTLFCVRIGNDWCCFVLVISNDALFQGWLEVAAASLQCWWTAQAVSLFVLMVACLCSMWGIGCLWGHVYLW